MTTDEQRVSEITESLATVEQRVADACAAAGRARDEVSLVVVTKFFPASDVRILARAGVRDIGENRDQEAGAKLAEVVADPGGAPVPRMHFIGQVQTNKAASVAAYADVVHSVDRVKLARALDKGAQRHGRTIDVLLQVDLRDPAEAAGDVAEFGRGGVFPDELEELAAVVEDLPGLRLRGLMCVAPLGEDPAEAFGRLVDLREPFVAAHPQATWLSAGMSADLEQGIAAGATHVRVGSAILGARPMRG
ncbi:MAG: YggS family pyridoxal phosphate-dependent enzyme [Dermatophilus congolensis]|nr:YggS family pyridoxal phosphate-dependent enzyme [Dermatophilus congolensis]